MLVNNLSSGHRVLIGTPSDGFNIDGVVAELQRRGRFRTEYETFRETSASPERHPAYF